MVSQEHSRSWIAVLAALMVTLGLTAGASAQDDGEYTLGGGGYDPSGGGGYDPSGGGGTGNGAKLDLKLTAKKKQKSLKAVKAKATCEGRACTIEAEGKLNAGGAKAKLKPDEESLAAGDTDPLKLKLAKRAKRTAKAAARDDEKLTVKVTANAKGVGGGGSDKASVKIKLKP